MTLNTKVALTGRIAPDAARDLAAKALLSAANSPDLGYDIQWSTQRAGTLPDWLADRDDLGPDQIKAWVEPCDKVRSVPGQGLPGIIQIRTSPHASPLPADTSEGHPAYNALIAWDSPYGYRDNAGRDAWSLHALALIDLHQSLPDGVTMTWCNEHTGQWHAPDDADALRDFLTHGDNARDWFTSTVLPTLRANGLDVTTE